MKNQLVIIAAFFLFVSTSCDGEVQTKEQKKERTEKIGILTNNKADVKEYSYTLYGKEVKEKQLPYGSTMEILIKGFEGFKEVKGKINTNVSLKLIGKDNVAVLDYADMFGESYPDGIPVELFQTKFYLSVKFQSPTKINNSYKVIATVADKNSDAKITLTEDFLLTPSKGLSYKEDGLTSDGIFLLLNNVDYDATYIDDKVSIGDTLRAVVTGLAGFVEKDNTVWVGASIKLCNEFGDVLRETKNVFDGYEKTGMSVADAKETYKLFYIIPDYLKPNTKYNFVYTFYDLKGKNTLTAKYDFVVK